MYRNVPTNIYFRPLLKWRRLFHRRASFGTAGVKGVKLWFYQGCPST